MRKSLTALALMTGIALLGCIQATSTSTGPVAGITGETLPSPAEDSTPVATGAAGAAGTLAPENTKIEFVGTKKGGKHDGGFKKFSGTIKAIDGDFTRAQIAVEIDTDSLWSDVPKLTNHLKNPDFFDVKKYPKASFTSTKIEENKKGDTTHLITGDLTLHGTTKPITFPAKVTQTVDTVTLESTFQFDRLEYGIAYAPDRVDKLVTVKVSAKIPRK